MGEEGWTDTGLSIREKNKVIKNSLEVSGKLYWWEFNRSVKKQVNKLGPLTSSSHSSWRDQL